MKITAFVTRPILGLFSLALFLGAFSIASPLASATVPDSACNQTANVSACKQKFKDCDKQSNPDLCKNEYLNTAAQLQNQPPPPESECNSASDPSACKKAYEQCGNGNDASTVNCKQRAVGQALLSQVGGQGVDHSGCTGNGCGHQCGASNQNPYTPAIDIGCKGQGNPIADAAFAFIRFASDGVGLVVIGSIIYGGIQYTGSRGDPQSTAMAINRIRSSVFALLIFIFAYAILNYLVPGLVLK